LSPENTQGTPALLARLAELEDRLREANETLDAIRNGDVDAVVVGGPAGQLVYTLESADRPYRVFVEQMKEGALTLTGEGLILYCNRSFADLAGSSPEHIVGTNLVDHIAEKHSVPGMLVRNRHGISEEVDLLVASGKTLRVNLSIVELEVDDGASRMLCGIVTDLTQHYARAHELGEARARLASETAERAKAEESLAIAMEAADMGSWEVRFDTGAGHQSIRHDAIFGYETPQTDWSFQKAIAHFVPDDREAVREAFSAARTTGRIEFERRIRRTNDGAIRWIHVKGRAVVGDDGHQRFVGIVVDNTDRRLIDDQLRQAQKMEAVGQLTGGVAHDFNNLLMIIGGSLEALGRRANLDPRLQKFLDAAQNGVARGAKLNQQLLAFARRQDMVVEPVCVNDLLPEFETLLDRALGETVSIEIKQGKDLWYCATDPHQLETAMLNLAINARDAMEKGGTIRLSTANVVVSADEARTWDAKPGDYVKSSIADSGPGMEESVLARVFEPFFTTKGVGKGTGLGLSQVYGFAKQSDGFVAIQSTVGLGTTASIYLPRTAPPAPAVRLQPDSTLVNEGQGTVLLVEDDGDVRAASRTMLEELGYTVREASNGVSALECLSKDDQVDIIFTDVIMSSGMNGIELARTIKAKWPRLPVLLASGYTAQHLAPLAMNGDPMLLRKPYGLRELATALQHAVDAIHTGD
jgi:PAS domain S-box-containing protein